MSRSSGLLFGAVFASTIGFDQWLKAWMRVHCAEHQSLGIPFPGVFELTLNYNRGVAFGMLQGKGVLMTPIAIGIAAYAAWHSLTSKQVTPWTHVLCGLMASGALGNLVDRLWLGKVTDMFWFRPINFPVFNVADSCITIATIMLVISWMRESGAEKESIPPVHEIPTTEIVATDSAHTP